ncbi:MAG: hypothetical protein IKD87_10475 [Oscillospiraceae bacterium]|jgi:hypothetical protein|nr:hypothetical protein [Oscillospiraceae bacterium]
MLTEEKRTRIAGKWEAFRGYNRRKRKKLLDHSFDFFIEYDGGVEDAFRFELDGREADLIGLGYAGPRKDDFVKLVTTLKEKDLLEVGYLYEPGEADLLFSRRKENIYIELPHLDDGFFLRYDYFVEKILEGYQRQ